MITNSQCDHLPVGLIMLIAQLVQHLTGIVEVVGINRVFFFQALEFHSCLIIPTMIIADVFI